MATLRQRFGAWVAGAKSINGVQTQVINVGGDGKQHTKFKEVASEGYKKSTDVFAALDHYANALGGIPWVVRQRTPNKRRSQWDILDEHPFYELWERPNPLYTQAEWIRRFVQYHWLAGEVYIQHAGARGKAPTELWLPRPDYMTPERVDGRVPYIRFKYQPNPMKPPVYYEGVHEEGGRYVGECWYTTFGNPLAELRGMSPFVPASLGINIGVSGRALNWHFMRNGARPSGIIITPEEMTDEQKAEITRQFTGKQTGETNAGKPIYAWGADENGKAFFQWIQTGMAPKDLDWSQGLRLATGDVARVTRIPPIKLGDYEKSTYSNSEQADRQMWTDAILPYADMLRDALNVFVMPFYGQDVWLDYDKSQIEALSEDQNDVWNRIKGAWWVSVGEARAQTGLDPLEDEEAARVLMVPSGLTPMLPEDLLIDMPDPGNDPADDVDDEPDADDE